MRRILHLIMCVKTFYYLLSDHASFDLLSHEIYAIALHWSKRILTFALPNHCYYKYDFYAPLI